MLTIGTQQIESFDGGIAANSRHRSHIQDAPDLCASAPDTTAAAQFSIIAVKRCQPGQCSDLALGFKRPGTDSVCAQFGAILEWNVRTRSET